MNKEKTIDTLNTLVEINNDRIEGYETAINETNEEDLKTIFSQFARTSHKCKVELIEEVRKLGGTPEKGTRTSGKFYRAWMDIKAALTGKDREVILNSCEFGEDVAIETYHKVLKDEIENLSAEQHALVSAQQDLIKADHDKVRSMRDMAVKL
jgi:uncharacterized protein (TIGR02284 family)